MKADKTKLAEVQRPLGETLYAMKMLHAKVGGNGQWSKLLRELHVSRATADRLVNRFADSKGLLVKRLNESISEPSEVQLSKLAFHVWEKCEKVLTTYRSRYDFVRCLLYKSGLAYDLHERGVLLFEPGFEPPKPEVIASEPRSATGDGYEDVL
jgi:hypothetical protein